MNSDALVNGVLSFIFPGVGQVINGDTKKGYIMIAVALIAALIIFWYHLGLIAQGVYFIYQVFAAYDAYNTY